MKGERKERDQLIILFEKKKCRVSLFVLSNNISFFLSFFLCVKPIGKLVHNSSPSRENKTKARPDEMKKSTPRRTR